MSKSIWFEEVNIGLVNEIKNSVKIKSNGEWVALEDSAIIVRKPDEDFKLEIFPCVSIYNKTYIFDPQRYNPEDIKVGEVEKTSVLEKPCVTYTLQYQLDFWSRLQTDMDSMTRSWLSTHFRQFNLPVERVDGEKTTVNCITQGNIARSDLVESSERLFHSITNFMIWVEIDEEIRYNKPMVIVRDIDTRKAE